jgi:drug/metabolite transporter (DMT)-like permease
MNRGIFLFDRFAMGYFYLSISVIFWGSGYVLSKIPIDQVVPSVAVFTRFFIVAICSLFILIYHWSTFTQLTRKDHLIFLTMGVALGIYNWFYLEGLARTNVIDSIFIETAFIPIFTVLIVYFFKTPISKNQWIGVSISILGCSFFFYPLLEVNSFHSERIIGIIILFLSVFSWILYTLLGKDIFSKVNILVGTSYAMIISSFFLLLIAYPDIQNVFWSDLHTDYWFTQLYLGICSSVIGNICYAIGIKKVGAATGSLFLFLVPIVGFLLAHLLIQETLTMIQFIGTFTMLIGVWHANKVGKSS